jgi:hypothetical protein
LKPLLKSLLNELAEGGFGGDFVMESQGEKFVEGIVKYFVSDCVGWVQQRVTQRNQGVGFHFVAPNLQQLFNPRSLVEINWKGYFIGVRLAES